MDSRKQAILDALGAFVRQRSGMDPRNYGDWRAYRAEQRSITRDLHHYRELAAYVSARDSITADMLLEASRSAYSGRLFIDMVPQRDGAPSPWRAQADYTTGQYFCVEYRRAACAVLASAIWCYWREKCMPKGELRHNSETGETFERYKLGDKMLRAGDWLRANARREFSRGLAARYFD